MRTLNRRSQVSAFVLPVAFFETGFTEVRVFFLFFLAPFLAAFNVGGLVFEADFLCRAALRVLYTMTRSDCTSLQPLGAGRETTVAVSTVADPSVNGPK